MRWSKYNLIYKSKQHGWLLFNKLSTFFLDINDSELRKSILKVKKDPIKYFNTNNDIELKEVLLKSSVIVENDRANVNYINYLSTKDKFERRNRGLTILPTLACNFACSYCYEKTNLKNKSMNDKTINEFKEFINKEYNFEETKRLHVQWYGGEPLLNYKAIKEISEFIKSKDVTYTAGIVTNGYLLNNNIINQLSNLNIFDLQITIDGTKKIHDKMRRHKNGEGTYDIIINNLIYLSNHIKLNKLNIRVSIRVNIGKENKNIFAKLKLELEKIFQNPNFFIYLGFIVDTNVCNTNDSCGLDNKEKAEFYIDQFKKYNILDLNYFPINFAATNCIAQRLFDYTIGPQGEFYSCWRDVGDKDEIIGHINTGYTNRHKVVEYTTGVTDVYRDNECLECESISICHGGCPNLRYRKYIQNQPQELCSYFKDEEILIKLMDIHYAIIKQKNTEV